MNDGTLDMSRIAEEGDRNHRQIESMMASRGIIGINARADNLHITFDYKGQRSQKLTFEQAVSYVSSSATADEIWTKLTADGLIRKQPKTN